MNDIKTFPHLDLYNFGEITFIAGTYKELYFNLYTGSGSPIDLTNTEVLWELSPFSYPSYRELVKTAESYNGYCLIKILSVNTLNLSGKFIHRLFISEINGYNYRLGQGLMNIAPAIGRSM